MSYTKRLTATAQMLWTIQKDIAAGPALLDFDAVVVAGQSVADALQAIHEAVENKKPVKMQAFAKLWHDLSAIERRAIRDMVVGHDDDDPA